jgi:hypothetical protein
MMAHDLRDGLGERALWGRASSLPVSVVLERIASPGECGNRRSVESRCVALDAELELGGPGMAADEKGTCGIRPAEPKGTG